MKNIRRNESGRLCERIKNIFCDIAGRKSYKKAGITLEKEENDYNYEVKRNAGYRKPRYTLKRGIWTGKKTQTANKAIIMCAGNLMCEPLMSETAYCDGYYHFEPMFKNVQKVLKTSDFAIANLETLVTEKLPYAHEMHKVKHHTGTRYHCNAPLPYLNALRFAGFDGFVLANNHNADGGYEGIIDTLKNVDNMGFARTGMFKKTSDPRTLIVDINGIKVGFLSYTEHINRDLDSEFLTDIGQNVLLNRFSKEKLEADINSAHSQGAEFLICYIHLNGIEYSNEVIQRNIDTAQIIADAGVDCIMGSHMHAIQRYDVIISKDGRKVPVVYSLGNFISSDVNKTARESVIYRLELEKDTSGAKIKSESYIPCRVVELFQKSWFTVFLTQKQYRTTKSSQLLDEAEKNIQKIMGNKIEMFDPDTKI